MIRLSFVVTKINVGFIFHTRVAFFDYKIMRDKIENEFLVCGDRKIYYSAKTGDKFFQRWKNEVEMHDKLLICYL